jgi:guanylate kinase
MQKEGLKIILSGPSGSGKGTIVKELIKKDNFIVSISATTRAPREGEIDGVHYFFKTKEVFEEMIAKDELLEYACFCDNYYGTPKAFINETIKQGKDVLLEIEVQGAMQVKRSYPDALFIFIIPPDMEELRKRLIGRNTETLDIIEQRLNRAKEELALYQSYDYVVMNDTVEQATNDILRIVESERLKSHRYQTIIENKFKFKGDY